MVDDSAPEAEAIVGISPAVQLLYANATQVQGAAFDVAVTFGYQVGESPPQWATRVAMSWEHAQVLAQSLLKAIEAFEGQVGPLPNLEKARVVQPLEESP